MSIPRASINHPVSVIMLTLAMVVVGFGALSMLNIALFPNIDIPVAFIMAPYEGVDPSEMETIVTKKIEDQVNTIENIKEIRSDSQEGRSVIIVEFNYGTDIDLAAVDVRSKVDIAKRRLPDEMDDIVTAKVDFNAMSVMNLAVGGQYDPVELRRIADRELKPAFQQIPGVASVDVYGGREREIRVKVFPEKLLAYNMVMDDITTAISHDNSNTSLGNITEASFRYLLRSDGRMHSAKELGDIIVKEIDGRPVYLSELAIIEDSYKDTSDISRSNGDISVTLAIKKVAEGNPVIIADAARKIIPGLEKKYNGKLKITVGKDQSEFIKDTIQMVKDNAIMGGIYAIIVLFLFLQNYRSTIIIGISIPVAVIATFGMLMFKKDITLNLMTLGGLALGIGMMVDNAIVVLENINRFFHEQKGKSKEDLAADATEEVYMPVIASTATTVVAFLPIGLVPEIVGEIFFNMSISIVFSLTASLIVAVTLIPMLCSKLLSTEETLDLEQIIIRMYKALSGWAKKHLIKFAALLAAVFAIPAVLYYLAAANTKISGLLTKFGAGQYVQDPGSKSVTAGAWVLFIVFILPAVVALISYLFNLLSYKIMFPLFNKLLTWFAEVYRMVLTVLTKNAFTRITYVIVVIGLFLLSIKYNPPFSMFPSMDRGELVVVFETAEGTAVEEVDKITEKIDSLFLAQPEVESVISRSKIGESNIDIKMVPKEKRTRSTEQVIQSLRAEIEAIPGIRTISFQEPKMGRNSNQKALQVEVYGDDFAVLKELCLQIYERIKDIDGLEDIENGVDQGRPELHLIFDREKIRDMGLNLVTIAKRTRTYIYGTVAGKYRESNDEYDIRVESADASKDKIARIKELEIALGNGKFVKLDQIAKFQQSSGYTTIKRKNVARVLAVQGEPVGKALGAITAEVSERIKDIEVPPGYRIKFGGENEDMQSSFKYLGIAFISSMLLVYMIMAAQFESIIYPFLIMFTIPLSYIGVVAGFQLMNFSFSVTAMIGMIMLAGIAVNNGIILIEYIIQRKQGLGESDAEAVIAAGALRLRPILMTTLTTLLGMLPLAFGYGSGADFYQPLAIAVAFGLMVSTLMTLTFVPTIFVMTENVKNFFSSFFSQFTAVTKDASEA